MKSLAWFFAFLVALICRDTPAIAQATQTEKTEQMIDEAHRGMLQPKPNTAADAGQTTKRLTAPLGPAAKAGAIPRKNFIDAQIFGRMERDRIPHASLSSDEEFVRRVYMDATGQLPSADAVRQFVADKNPQKRDALVDTLVASDEFAEQWGWLWGDLFRVLGRSGDGNQGHVFHYWNKEWIHADRPYNEVVHDLLVASAKSHSAIPATNLIGQNSYDTNVLPGSPDDFSVGNRLDAIDDFNIDTARIFLGLNLNCISCHDGAGHLEQINDYLAAKERADFARESAFMGNLRTVVHWGDRGKNTSNDDQVIDDLAAGYNTASDAPWMTTSLNRMPRDGKSYEPAFILTGEKPQPG